VADLDTLARRAGAAARTEARARGQRMSPPGQRVAAPSPSPWRGPALAAFVVLVAVVLAVVGGRLVGDTGLVIDPVGPVPEPGTLLLPEVGMASAGYLEDGTPVFVSRPDDGTVLVLDATSPHHDLEKLIAFCASSGWFEDLYHGSRFTAWGDWVAGPSPTGLPAYPSELTSDGRHVRVTGAAGPAPERGTSRGPDEGPRGPACEPGYDDLTSAVVHRPPAVPAALGGDGIPADRWVWATLVIGGAEDRAIVCEVDTWCPDGAPETVPAARPFHVTAADDGPWRGVWLARAGPDRTVFLRRPGMPFDNPLEEWEHGIYPVPAPGEAVAHLGPGDRPIFVAVDEAGEVRILDATSPQRPTALLGWCADVGRFADGWGAAYDVTGAAIDGGTGLHGYPTEVDDLGRGIRAARVTMGPNGWWGRPAFTAELASPSARQASPCVDPVAHVPGHEREVEGDDPPLDERGSWFWVEARVRILDGVARVCLESESCVGRDDPIVVTPGADGIPWPDGPRWLFVEVDEESIPGPDEPQRVHVRRPILQERASARSR
jgi:hypothetical protein